MYASGQKQACRCHLGRVRFTPEADIRPLGSTRPRCTDSDPPTLSHQRAVPVASGLRPSPGRMIVQLPRRKFLHLAACAAALPAVPRVARAQAYPSRPVRLIVGFAAGGGNDIVARLIGQWLSDRLGQPFVVENRPGAGSNLATQAVVNAAPDGYTLLVVGATNAINVSYYQKLNFNFVQDIAPVASITHQPQIMLAVP